MIRYYEEQLKLAQEVSRLTEHGFISKVREIADALSICSKDDVKAISEELNRAVEAMAEVDSNVTYYEAKIDAEKEEKKKDELLSM